ncbi:MAG: hypothetical protein F6K55_13605 [Moorea sp. SIO4A3]|nr:hypothetical protein [Moorena sp. SIO4A3]
MSEVLRTFNFKEINKGINYLGLNLSDLELKLLQVGETVSLDARDLSEIGSVFILAAALSAKNSDQPKKTVIFQDLPKNCSGCSGLPIHCWTDESIEKHCLCLTLVNGSPAVGINCPSKCKSQDQKVVVVNK